MIPYVLLLVVPALFSFVAVDHAYKPSRLRISIKKDPLIAQNNPALPVFFILLLIMLCLRHETVGRDLVSYKLYFEVFPLQNLEYFDLFRIESLFRIFTWFVGQFTDNFQIYLCLVAILTVVPIAYVYAQDRRNSYLQMVLFVSMSTFVMIFSGLRQAITMALGMIAYVLVKKKKRLLFVCVTILALGIHHSAFMIALMYPLYYARIKKNHLWFVVPIVAAVFLFNRPIFRAMTTLLAEFTEKYELELQPTGAYTMMFLFAAFVALSYLLADEKKMDEEMFGLRNFLLMALLLQCFAPVHPLAMRLNYYFIIFVPMALAKFVSIPRAGTERLMKWAKVIIAVYFTYDFLSKTYVSYKTGISALDTIPYLPFWK